MAQPPYSGGDAHLVSTRFGLPVHVVRSRDDWHTWGKDVWSMFVDEVNASEPVPPSATQQRQGIAHPTANVASRPPLPLVGLDAEWVGKGPIAVLQFASQRRCVVLHVHACRHPQGRHPPANATPPGLHQDNTAVAAAPHHHHVDSWDGIPPEVRAFVADPRVVKCGVNLNGDAKRLEREHRLHVAAPLEIDHVALHAGRGTVGKGQLGLGALAQTVLGVELGKDIGVTLSDWEAAHLSDEQLHYAADDAMASALIAAALYDGHCHATSITELQSAKGPCQVTCAAADGAADGAEDHLAANQEEDTDRSRTSHPFRQWAAAVAAPAMDAFKRAHKEFSKATTNLTGPGQPRPRRAQDGDPYDVEGLATRLTQAIPTSYNSVRVLDRHGHYIFSCDVRKSEWYKRRRLAKAVTHTDADASSHNGDGNGTSTAVATIQLTFDPNVKTKLCMHHQLGTCTIGAHCPYAHGPEELVGVARTEHAAQTEQVPARTTTTSPDRVPVTPPTGGARPRRDEEHCAICMSTGRSMKHAVVPPSLRRFLPPPFHCGVSDDFVLVCFQCNPRVRIAYDAHLKRHYRDAEVAAGSRAPLVDVNKIKRVVGYAQILLSAARPTQADDDESEEEAPPADDSPADVPDGKPRVRRTAPACVPEERKAEMRKYIHEHWSCTQLRASAGGASPVSDGYAGEESIDALFDEAEVVEIAGLERLAKVSPGVVRARAVMDVLVGRDADKAAAFVSEWRRLFQSSLRPAFVPWDPPAATTSAALPKHAA